MKSQNQTKDKQRQKQSMFTKRNIHTKQPPLIILKQIHLERSRMMPWFQLILAKFVFLLIQARGIWELGWIQWWKGLTTENTNWSARFVVRQPKEQNQDLTWEDILKHTWKACYILASSVTESVNQVTVSDITSQSITESSRFGVLVESVDFR